ncbi:MAG: hypothetical protein WBO55_18205 [Rhizobiaceae bacterium]
MSRFDASQIMMLAGMGIFFVAYLALIARKHQAGKQMIMERDARLYPPDYDSLNKADRRRLYRIHTWRAAWDMIGKLLAALAAFGVLLFLTSVVISLGKP